MLSLLLRRSRPTRSSCPPLQQAPLSWLRRPSLGARPRPASSLSDEPVRPARGAGPPARSPRAVCRGKAALGAARCQQRSRQASARPGRQRRRQAAPPRRPTSARSTLAVKQQLACGRRKPRVVGPGPAPPHRRPHPPRHRRERARRRRTKARPGPGRRALAARRARALQERPHLPHAHAWARGERRAELRRAARAPPPRVDARHVDEFIHSRSRPVRPAPAHRGLRRRRALLAQRPDPRLERHPHGPPARRRLRPGRHRRQGPVQPEGPRRRVGRARRAVEAHRRAQLERRVPVRRPVRPLEGVRRQVSRLAPRRHHVGQRHARRHGAQRQCASLLSPPPQPILSPPPSLLSFLLLLAPPRSSRSLSARPDRH